MVNTNKREERPKIYNLKLLRQNTTLHLQNKDNWEALGFHKICTYTSASLFQLPRTLSYPCNGNMCCNLAWCNQDTFHTFVAAFCPCQKNHQNFHRSLHNGRSHLKCLFPCFQLSFVTFQKILPVLGMFFLGLHVSSCLIA